MSTPSHFRSYCVGFILSVLLVLLAYGLVQHHALDEKSLYLSIALIALVQLFLQMIFIFRLGVKTEHDRWSMIVFIFTLIIVAIVVSGSLWIMYNLNYYMVN